jgi:hypothetical protein
MRAVLYLGPQGEPKAPVILCADSEEEARTRALPLFTTIFAQLTEGMELNPIGNGYSMSEKGKPVGTLEIFDPPLNDGKGDGA